MKVVGFPNPSGSAFWRLKDPFTYLQKVGVDARLSQEGITEEIAKWADVYVLQGTVDKDGIALLYQYQQEHGKKIVVEQDDRIEVEDTNIHKKEHEVANASEVIKTTLGIADLVTTTTQYLAGKLSEYNSHVAVLPNFLDMKRWDLPKYPNTSREIRIGWAGSLTHLEDLLMIEKPLKKILKEFPQARLIIVGEPRIADYFVGYKTEIMMGVPFEAWPSKLHSLRLDIGIAPLRDSDFNKCKSNIKWLEYSIARVPGVYSPTVYKTRKFEPDHGFIATNEDEWYHSLKNLILHKSLREELGHNSHAYVHAWFDLEKHIGKWKEAYQSLFV